MQPCATAHPDGVSTCEVQASLHPGDGSPRTCEAAAAVKALRVTSVTRWLVSTLPPTTAASAEGLSRQPLGIRTVMGFMHPCSHTHT